ncbi:MAG TPA: HAMP domain-containing sensor histidine kinase [Polyangiaceae bacterium]|nr:HAMP domain-containing sensor histidine kinase [Polyangiaceae bacterium]
MEPAEVDLESDQLLARAATSAERAYSIGRALFSILLVIRHRLTCSVEDAWFVSPMFLALTAFSAWILSRPKDRILSRQWLRLSVLLDAAVCAGVLFTVAWWPAPDYAGLPTTPDFAVILLLILATSLRLYVDVVLLGIAANLVFSVGLLGFDLSYNGAMWQDGLRRVSVVFAFFVGASILAYLFVARTRSLVRDAARSARSALQSSMSIQSVLRVQHDTKSLVSALTLRIDRLMRDSSRGDPFLADHMTHLNDCVQELAQHVSLAMSLARVDPSSREVLATIPLQPALDNAIRSVRRDYEDVTVGVCGAPEGAAVLLKGGSDALQQVFTRLLTNAAQGDGTTRATRIAVLVEATPPRLRVSVSDDGPGFPEHVLQSQATRPVPSCKPHSSGLGLWLVGNVTRSSGGSLAMSNRAPRGALIVLELLTPPAHEAGVDAGGQKLLPLSDEAALD